MTWFAIFTLAAGSYGFKLAGVLAGPRLTGPLMKRAILLLPPALFTALIALQSFERDRSLVLDARVVGLVVALVATWRRVPFVGVIIAAMVATALTRLIAG